MSSKPASPRPHDLKLQTSTAGGVSTIRCTGRLTAEVSATLRDECKALIPGATRIVLDLTDLSYMDSAGLGTLAGIYVSAKRVGCGLEIINFNKRVRELLGLTHLLSVFESCARHSSKIP